MTQKKIIISGGGTGGHVFPAIAIANALKAKLPECEILFVGAQGKMEMEKVPQAGYKIIGLPVQGFARRLTVKNISFFWKLLKSMILSKRIIRTFKPDVAVGVGGYASGPILKAAISKGIPAVLQEQNSYAGITNRILGRKANTICVAYKNMEKFFPKEKIILTGNPVRKDLLNADVNKTVAKEYFNISADKKFVLILGGSGGARQINQAIIENIDKIKTYSKIVFLLQCGKHYYNDVNTAISESTAENIIVRDFISDMNIAYSAADLIITRSGAGTISELCLLGKPVVFVPSPNVAEDHQTKNALALVENKAAKIIKDDEAIEKLIPVVEQIIHNDEELKKLSANIKSFAYHNSAERIADEILKLI